MGAMNKHPSCRITWEETIKASLAFSNALASLMSGNVHLEHVLLAELDDKENLKDSAMRMIEEVEASRVYLVEAQSMLVASIKRGEEMGNPYENDFKALNPGILAELWDQGLLMKCSDEVRKIGHELKRDHLETARRLVAEVDNLIRLTDPVIETFKDAALCAESGSLKLALENNELPLQARFATLFSRYLVFMREYLVDSLIATEVVFRAKGKRSLAS